MGPFEYLSVLLSIVLGLGITQLLAGFGRWLEQREEFSAWGPAIAWAVFLFLVHVQTWWSMFGMRRLDEWTFLQFSVVLLQPVVLFLLATLVFPGAGAPHQDLRENFLRQRPWFFGLLLALVAVSLAKDLVLQGSLPERANLAFHGIVLGLGVLGLTVRREGVQRTLAYLSLVWAVVYITLLFGELG